MINPSDLTAVVESLGEHLDQAFWKISGMDRLIERGQQHLLVPGLSISSLPDHLCTQPDVGGAQTTLVKGLMTLPAGTSSSTCGSSNLPAFSVDSLWQFDASQEFARQIVDASQASVFSYAG